MADDITEQLLRVQEELSVLKAELVALNRVVEEIVWFQASVALDPAAEPGARVAAALRVLRKVVDLAAVK